MKSNRKGRGIMTKQLKAIQEYCDSQNWNYSVNEEKNYLTMRMSLRSVESCTIYAQARGEDGFTIYTVFPLKAPEGKRDAVAAFLTRANYGLIVGNFELDFDDGEIRYKVTAINGEDNLLPPDVTERLFDMGFCMFDRYGEGLLSVIYGNAAPIETVDAIERRDDEQEEEDAPVAPTALGGTMLS